MDGWMNTCSSAKRTPHHVLAYSMLRHENQAKAKEKASRDVRAQNNRSNIFMKSTKSVKDGMEHEK